MKQPIDAIYEHGMFRPLQPEPLGIADGERVRIIVEAAAEPEPLRLATAVYEGLSTQEIDEVEKITLRRGDFFGGRNSP